MQQAQIVIDTIAGSRSATVQAIRPPAQSSGSVSGSTNLLIPRAQDAPSAWRGAIDRQKAPTPELLFDNLASLKVLSASVSMHLSRIQRADLFKQIDELLDPENWVDDDDLISEASFQTFLRFVIYSQNLKRPALSVVSPGYIASSWIGADYRLTIEFRPSDVVRLSLSRKIAGTVGSESSVYQGPLTRVGDFLQSFDGIKWYQDEKKNIK